jgi:hypothetical protein
MYWKIAIVATYGACATGGKRLCLSQAPCFFQVLFLEEVEKLKLEDTDSL